MKTSIKGLLTAFVLTLFALPGLAAAADTVLVAHPAVGTAALTKKDVSRLFMRQESDWPSGEKAKPVDQAKGPVREAFCKDVLGKTLGVVESYWTQAIFSGKAVPPPEKKSDADVLAYVKETPGAIGYVSAAAPMDGVKKITLKD